MIYTLQWMLEGYIYATIFIFDQRFSFQMQLYVHWLHRIRFLLNRLSHGLPHKFRESHVLERSSIASGCDSGDVLEYYNLELSRLPVWR